MLLVLHRYQFISLPNFRFGTFPSFSYLPRGARNAKVRYLLALQAFELAILLTTSYHIAKNRIELYRSTRDALEFVNCKLKQSLYRTESHE